MTVHLEITQEDGTINQGHIFKLIDQSLYIFVNLSVIISKKLKIIIDYFWRVKDHE